MKILFYIEPWIEKGRPFWKNSWIPIFKDIAAAIAFEKDVELYFLVGDAQKSFADDLVQFGGVGIIDQSQLYSISKGYSSIIESWYTGTYSDQQLKLMQEVCLSRLNGFVPDVIWSFVSPVPFLTKLFPKALPLYQELGLLGRNPYPSTWYLDPFGTFGNSYIKKYSEDLMRLPLTKTGKRSLNLIREKYQNIIKENSPFDRSFLDPEGRFRKLVLLPLQYSGYFIFDSMCDYSSQYEYLEDVLQNTPGDIGVVVTQHINPVSEIVLNQDLIDYLRAVYPNFIYSEEFESYHMSSQYLLGVVDAVVSVSSTVGLQALFWEKALISVSRSHLSSLAHINSFSDLSDLYDFSYDRESRDNILYFLFTRYYIPHLYIQKNGWLYRFLKRSLEKKRGFCLDFNFFDLIDSEEEILKFYLENDLPFAKTRPKKLGSINNDSPTLEEYKSRIRFLNSKLEDSQLELLTIKNSRGMKFVERMRPLYKYLTSFKGFKTNER
jgi:hypothetical protein